MRRSPARGIRDQGELSWLCRAATPCSCARAASRSWLLRGARAVSAAGATPWEGVVCGGGVTERVIGGWEGEVDEVLPMAATAPATEGRRPPPSLADATLDRRPLSVAGEPTEPAERDAGVSSRSEPPSTTEMQSRREMPSLSSVRWWLARGKKH